MPVTSTVAQARQALESEHRRLRDLVTRLLVADDLPALARLLGELHAMLVAHFNAEEKPGGLYEALGVCAPDLRDWLAELVDEHLRIAGMARDLCDRAQTAPGTDGDTLRGETARLAAALTQHEKRENAVVDVAVKGAA